LNLFHVIHTHGHIRIHDPPPKDLASILIRSLIEILKTEIPSLLRACGHSHDIHMEILTDIVITTSLFPYDNSQHIPVLWYYKIIQQPKTIIWETPTVPKRLALVVYQTFYKEYKHASLLCIQLIYPHIFLVLLTYIHDVLNHMHNHKPMCSYHRYISQFIWDWNSYLKSIYKFPNSMDTILVVPTKEEVFSLDDIEFGVKRLANGKAKDIEGYQDENFKIRGPILIPHIHKLFNLAVKHGFPKPWTQIFIVPIFKNGDINIPSNYRTIMISPILAKLYGIILEKKISLWIESHGKRAIGQAGFRRYHSTADHIFTFRIIAKEFCHNKKNIFCFFVYFRKSFDMVPRKNLWKRLEEIKVPLELRVSPIRMYENVISKIKNTKCWSKEINCNIGVKQGCPLSPTIFCIYIDKLEYCLEKAGYVEPTLTGIVNLILYDDDISLMERSPHDVKNELRILKDFFSNMGKTVKTDKTKVMIIKSNTIPYDTFVYENNNMEEVTSYKYLGIDIHHNLNWNYSIEKRIIRGWKDYYGLERNCKSTNLWSWDKKKILFETLVTPVILYGCEFWGCIISHESSRNIEQIQKNFITYNLKIKENTPCPILLL
jgi:hypothetical protein